MKKPLKCWVGIIADHAKEQFVLATFQRSKDRAKRKTYRHAAGRQCEVFEVTDPDFMAADLQSWLPSIGCEPAHVNATIANLFDCIMEAMRPKGCLVVKDTELHRVSDIGVSTDGNHRLSAGHGDP